MKKITLSGLLLLFWALLAPAQAAMVPTLELAIESANPPTAVTAEQRRQTVQQLIERGVDPAEAEFRVGQMTDAQVLTLKGEIDALPAGAGIGTTNLLLIIIVLILIL
ncbi:MAG TPA: PA2779 family protein [Gammaproteobacteria bacterium]|nr:PA2779 family protein [Gammaproteobacteria bacterium]